LVIARDEIIPNAQRTWSQEPSLLGFHHHVEKTNDQIDPCGGCSGCGSRIRNRGLGRPQQYRATEHQGYDDDQYRRQL
jgi:hypothetical protein